MIPPRLHSVPCPVRLGSLALLTVLLAAPARAGQDSDLMLPGVPLGAHATADIHVRVYANDGKPANDKTLLVVPGTNEDADTWAEFATAVLADGGSGPKVSRVLVLDFPGIGASSLPTAPLLFGEVTLENQARVLLEVLPRLAALGFQPRTIVAHGLGGLPVQLAQQQLIEGGSSLREAFDIRHVMLLASALPKGFAWAWAERTAATFGHFHDCFTGAGGVVGQGCESSDLDHDGDVDYSDLTLAFPIGFDCNPATTPLGQPPLPAPDAGQCDDSSGLGDTSDAGAHPASLAAVLQGVGALQYARPRVEPGAFVSALGTRLTVVNFGLDGTHIAGEDQRLWGVLSGHNDSDQTGKGGKGSGKGDDNPQGNHSEFLKIEGPLATPDMPLVSPAELLDALSGHVKLL